MIGSCIGHFLAALRNKHPKVFSLLFPASYTPLSMENLGLLEHHTVSGLDQVHLDLGDLGGEEVGVEMYQAVIVNVMPVMVMTGTLISCFIPNVYVVLVI